MSPLVLTYVLNQININLNKRNLKFYMRYAKKNLVFLNLFKKCGVVSSFYILTVNNKKKICVYLLYFKGLPLFKNFKIMSTSRKTYHVSLYALKLFQHRLGNTNLILSTTKGIITHHEALRSRVGGSVIGFF